AVQQVRPTPISFAKKKRRSSRHDDSQIVYSTHEFDLFFDRHNPCSLNANDFSLSAFNSSWHPCVTRIADGQGGGGSHACITPGRLRSLNSLGMFAGSTANAALFLSVSHRHLVSIWCRFRVDALSPAR